MKVLITGATGLVGTALTNLCHKNDILVHYLTTSKNKIETRENYRGFYWNVGEGILDEACFDGVDTIVHLAGASIAQRWTALNKKIILDSRVETANLLFDALSRKRTNNFPNSIKHFISASAIGGYPSSLTKIYNESYPAYASGFLGTVVEKWEQAALKFQQLDMMTTLVRTGIILDKDEGALAKMSSPISFGVGAPLGSGKQWQSWIHRDDMAGIYLHILKNELPGVYNGVAPNPSTNKELTQHVADILHKPLFVPKVPKLALKLLLGDMSAIVLESQKVSAQKIKEAGYQFKFNTLDVALNDLII